MSIENDIRNHNPRTIALETGLKKRWIQTVCGRVLGKRPTFNLNDSEHSRVLAYLAKNRRGKR